MFSQIGATEILIILGIVVLLFGAKKLPELARGSGEALRIFKSEVKADDKPEAIEAQALESSADQAEKKPEQQA
ncbi:MAG TPA: twin-arginine translocase TatA/TatE family subunit [Aeromicrobium sp.]|jgi:sec-independent protein translocase protein TatA|nr:twin-arginine translocase TatA/TatE family subunit [Aeromicrobium sp.]HKY56785.1 twin-arginine translocase TatA/TatE family subunit [Aeromicrobium sp.]